MAKVSEAIRAGGLSSPIEQFKAQLPPACREMDAIKMGAASGFSWDAESKAFNDLKKSNEIRRQELAFAADSFKASIDPSVKSDLKEVTKQCKLIIEQKKKFNDGSCEMTEVMYHQWDKKYAKCIEMTLPVAKLRASITRVTASLRAAMKKREAVDPKTQFSIDLDLPERLMRAKVPERSAYYTEDQTAVLLASQMTEADCAFEVTLSTAEHSKYAGKLPGLPESTTRLLLPLSTIGSATSDLSFDYLSNPDHLAAVAGTRMGVVALSTLACAKTRQAYATAPAKLESLKEFTRAKLDCYVRSHKVGGPDFCALHVPDTTTCLGASLDGPKDAEKCLADAYWAKNGTEDRALLATEKSVKDAGADDSRGAVVENPSNSGAALPPGH